MEIQWQAKGDVITVSGQKPMLENSVNRDLIAKYANDVDSTDNNQP